MTVDNGPYPVGRIVKTTYTFRNYDETPTDPTMVVFKYENPSGTEVTITYPAAGITKTGTGVYYAEVVLNAPGSWWRRWNGSGVIQDGFEAPWYVTHSMFA